MIIYYIIMIDDMGLIASDSESGVLHPAVVAVADIPGAGHGVGTASVIILRQWCDHGVSISVVDSPETVCPYPPPPPSLTSGGQHH